MGVVVNEHPASETPPHVHFSCFARSFTQPLKEHGGESRAELLRAIFQFLSLA